MKRKSLTMILCLLTCLSLVGVGFASWVISSGDKETVSGNVVVDTVSDERIVLTVTEPGVKDIKFVGPSSTTTADGWLTTDNKAANLEVTYACTVSKKTGSFTSTSEIATPLATLVEPTESTYTTAKTKGCFELSTDVGVTAATLDKFYQGIKISTPTLEDGKIKFNVTVQYKWGSEFGGINPFDYYNELKTGVNPTFVRDVNATCGEAVDTISAEDATWGDHAYYYLDLLSKLDSNGATEGGLLSYSLTIQVDFA
ncbi:MAG: hypothetical protein J6K18_05185 [Bacilli bacterium]|nr:hypothetical protein [Bacilli bacterium]